MLLKCHSMAKSFLLLFAVLSLGGGLFWPLNKENHFKKSLKPSFYQHPLSIEALRKTDFPGSKIIIEKKLEPGSNYDRFLASYRSQGLKIYALLTVPFGKKPENGWPAIIFNHGYIPPREYKTTEKYLAYTDGFSRNGYVVFKPDYRGHGNSEGEARGGYGSNDYSIDILNSISSIKNYNDVNSEKIGMWGHSMGGQLTLRCMVASKDIKAGVVWAGVVAPYSDLVGGWLKKKPSAVYASENISWEEIKEKSKDSALWDSVSPNSFLKDLSGPIQLHHGTGDKVVPYQFSEKLADQLKKEGKDYEYYTYEEDNHNISANFGKAMRRSVEFFDKYLK